MFFMSKKKKEYNALPKFKYIAHNDEAFVYSKKPIVCQCCKQAKNWISNCGIFARAEVEYLCPECIQSGKASKQYDGTFNNTGSNITDPALIEEVTKRTPTLNTCQEFDWIDCCGDYCTFVKFLKTSDLKNKELMNSIKTTYESNESADLLPLEEFNTFLKEDGGNILLFHCEKCNSYHVIVDLD